MVSGTSATKSARAYHLYGLRVRSEWPLPYPQVHGPCLAEVAFVRAGHRVLTDDLLVLSEQDDAFMAQPGPPRIKLFPEIARAVLSPKACGIPIAKMTPKLVIPLEEGQTVGSAVPLKIVYVL